MARIIRTSRAKLDVLEIWFYIAGDNMNAADKLVDAFDETLAMLAQNPEAGRARPELARHLRSFSVGNYVILYRPIPEGIEIIRIVHGARDIDDLFLH